MRLLLDYGTWRANGWISPVASCFCYLALVRYILQYRVDGRILYGLDQLITINFPASIGQAAKGAVEKAVTAAGIREAGAASCRGSRHDTQKGPPLEGLFGKRAFK